MFLTVAHKAGSFKVVPCKYGDFKSFILNSECGKFEHLH
jgi:hypothetical protein